MTTTINITPTEFFILLEAFANCYDSNANPPYLPPHDLEDEEVESAVHIAKILVKDGRHYHINEAYCPKTYEEYDGKIIESFYTLQAASLAARTRGLQVMG